MAISFEIFGICQDRRLPARHSWTTRKKTSRLTDAHPLRGDDAAFPFLFEVDGEPERDPGFVRRNERSVGQVSLREYEV